MAKVGFGSKLNYGLLIVDTNSDYTAINELTCDGCKNKVYDEAGSTTKSDVTADQTITVRYTFI